MKPHESHRMIALITTPTNHHTECYACQACTCHRIEELVLPCEGKFK
jgi:hypothetical protein